MEDEENQEGKDFYILLNTVALCCRPVVEESILEVQQEKVESEARERAERSQSKARATESIVDSLVAEVVLVVLMVAQVQ